MSLALPYTKAVRKPSGNFSPIELTLSCHLFSTIRGSLSFFRTPCSTLQSQRRRLIMGNSSICGRAHEQVQNLLPFRAVSRKPSTDGAERPEYEKRGCYQITFFLSGCFTSSFSGQSMRRLRPFPTYPCLEPNVRFWVDITPSTLAPTALSMTLRI